MSLISMEFLLFVGIASVGYYLIPKQYQWIWLLIFSYIYYASSGVKLLFFLLYTTIITYGTGRLLEWINRDQGDSKEEKKRRKARKKSDSDRMPGIELWNVSSSEVYKLCG